LPLGSAWAAVIVTGIVGGLAGGLFSRTIIGVTGALRKPFGRSHRGVPIAFAAVCGLTLAGLGLLSGDSIYGTGYEQARALIAGTSHTDIFFGPEKWLANAVSYIAGIPGGIFSPALAVGAGLGADIAPYLPHTDSTAVVLLGMSAYLTGVTQAPLTSVVISMELADDHDFVLPILATCLIARTFSTLICKVPVYRAFADRLLRDYDAEHAR
jgi:H+/Cl- antiporter ClcA